MNLPGIVKQEIMAELRKDNTEVLSFIAWTPLNLYGQLS